MYYFPPPSKEENGQIPLSLKISTSYLFGVGGDIGFTKD